MNNQSFDKACREKLNSFSGENYTPDWDNFSQIFDSANRTAGDIRDDFFDSAVSEKLSHLPEMAVPPHLFNKVYQDFVYGQWRRHNIYVIKLCEMIAVALLLFTFKNHFIPERLPSANKADLRAYNTRHHDIRDVKMPHKVPFKSAKIKNINKTGNSISQQQSSKSQNQSNEKLRGDYSGPLNSQLPPLNHVFAEDSVISHRRENNVVPDGIILKSAVNLSDVHSEHAEIFPLVLTEIKQSTGVAYEFSLGMGVNAYQINTPFDRVYSIASYKRETMASVLAAGIGMTLDRWSVISGLEYSRLYYRPEIVSESFNMQPELFFETSLKSIQYDLIQIPLKLRYTIWRGPRAGFYAEAGISTHLIWDASYDVATYVRPGRPSVRYIEETPRLEDKNFTPGISKNLLLKDNYFSGMLIGLGGEMKIWNNIKIFGQASYSRHFIGDRLGVGPNDDRIHYASGQAGLRWSIR